MYGRTAFLSDGLQMALEHGKQLMNSLLGPNDNLPIALPIEQLDPDTRSGVEWRNMSRHTLEFVITILQLLVHGALRSLAGKLWTD